MSSCDDQALRRTTSSDGSSQSLRALLDRLDSDAIAVAGLPVHTPNLGYVLRALKSSATTRPGGNAVNTAPYAMRDWRTRARCPLPQTSVRGATPGLCAADQAAGVADTQERRTREHLYPRRR